MVAKQTGTTWYNLYSDGWVEQGGKAGGYTHTFSGTYPTAYSPTTISLPIEMSTVGANVSTNLYSDNNRTNAIGNLIDTTNLELWVNGINTTMSNGYIIWEISGYAANTPKNHIICIKY